MHQVSGTVGMGRRGQKLDKYKKYLLFIHPSTVLDLTGLQVNWGLSHLATGKRLHTPLEWSPANHRGHLDKQALTSMDILES